MTTKDSARNPFWVVCARCRHIWAAGFWPSELGAFVKGMRGAAKFCPQCGSPKIYVARQVAGFCLEGLDHP